jgi:hypothetical protein
MSNRISSRERHGVPLKKVMHLMTMLMMKVRATFVCRKGNVGDGREETFICLCIEDEISVIDR